MFGPGEYVPDPTEGIVNANDLPMPLVVPYDRNHPTVPALDVGIWPIATNLVSAPCMTSAI
jgi:hypothetical protein